MPSWNTTIHTRSLQAKASRLRIWLAGLRMGAGADTKLLHFFTSTQGGAITEPRELVLLEPDGKEINAATSLVPELKVRCLRDCRTNWLTLTYCDLHSASFAASGVSGGRIRHHRARRRRRLCSL